MLIHRILNLAYIVLPYPVDEANGSAKFDKSRRELVVTLPVIKPDIPVIKPDIPVIEPDIPVTKPDIPAHVNHSVDEEKASENNLEELPDTSPSNSTCNDNNINTITNNLQNENELTECNSINDSDNTTVDMIVNGLENEVIENGDVFNEEHEKNILEEFVLMDDIKKLDPIHDNVAKQVNQIETDDLMIEMATDLAGTTFMK